MTFLYEMTFVFYVIVSFLRAWLSLCPLPKAFEHLKVLQALSDVVCFSSKVGVLALGPVALLACTQQTDLLLHQLGPHVSHMLHLHIPL